jgi:Arc/MetJ family transcription regulator
MCILTAYVTHPLSPAMRTNIVIDEKLMAEALRLTGASTKRRVVEDSLRLMIQLKRQERIRSARGKLKWRGDLEAMRRDR